MLVNAYVLYNGTTGEYVGNLGQTISINCERLQAFSPRPVWLKRYAAPGDGTLFLAQPTFSPTSAEVADANTLQGFWIEQDGQDVMIDVTTAAAFQAACDACCGTVPAIIANNYAGVPTAFTPLTTNFVCITRADDGSAGAHDDFAADYVSQFIGTARLRNNVSGVSKYEVETYWTYLTMPLSGADTIANGHCSG